MWERPWLSLICCFAMTIVAELRERGTLPRSESEKVGFLYLIRLYPSDRFKVGSDWETLRRCVRIVDAADRGQVDVGVGSQISGVQNVHAFRAIRRYSRGGV